jgi:O-antigen/teichoic acid export membrane protein
VLARNLGASGLGIYSVGLAVGLFLTKLLQVGLPRLLAREINHASALGESGKIRGVMQFAMLVFIGFSTIFGLAVYVGWPFIAAWLPSMYLHAVLGGLVSAPIVALSNICSGGLQGWHKVGLAAVSETALRSGLMLMLLIATLITMPGWLTPGRAVGLNVAAAAFALAIAAALLLRHSFQRILGARASYSVAAWSGSMVRFTAAGGLMAAEQQMLTFILAIFASDSQVGLFRIAQRAAGLANLGLTTIANVIGPHLGQHHARGEKERMQILVTRSAQAMAASALMVTLVFAVFGGELLDIAVGPEFRSAHLPLVVLSIGLFIRACFGPLEMLMNMTGQEGALVRARVVAITTTLFASIALMGENAAVGASVAAGLGMLALSLMVWRDARRLLDCRITAVGI